MPQMMPLNWITLLFMFIIIFIVINYLNYFNFTYLNKSSTMKKYLKFNWKW